MFLLEQDFNPLLITTHVVLVLSIKCPNLSENND